MATQRQQRVQELLKQEISDVIQHQLQDPLIGFVTVTDVAVSVDLRHARVYVSVLGDPQAQRDSFKALRRGAKYVRAQLAQRLDLKFVPELAFHQDRTAERAQRIEGLLRDIAAERTDAIATGDDREDNTPEEFLPPDDPREA